MYKCFVEKITFQIFDANSANVGASKIRVVATSSRNTKLFSLEINGQIVEQNAFPKSHYYHSEYQAFMTANSANAATDVINLLVCPPSYFGGGELRANDTGTRRITSHVSLDVNKIESRGENILGTYSL